MREFDPLDGEVGFKVYANGVGLIADDQLKLTAITMTSDFPEEPRMSVLNCGIR